MHVLFAPCSSGVIVNDVSFSIDLNQVFEFPVTYTRLTAAVGAAENVMVTAKFPLCTALKCSDDPHTSGIRSKA